MNHYLSNVYSKKSRKALRLAPHPPANKPNVIVQVAFWVWG